MLKPESVHLRGKEEMSMLEEKLEGRPRTDKNMAGLGEGS